ncbi:MAG TPA: ISL3 family transposase [Ktedonobacteraceae bacterium]|nr:ISL3 family transposase [Ktedonobacteraceae bacterium]
MMAMERSPFLPLPEGMVIGQVEITQTQLTVEVISTPPCACCPGCGNPSDSVHCQYQRTVHDVPCGGRKVMLRLSVRKFVCRTATCPRKVFAERLADLVQPWARISNRLLEELKAIGLSASAEVSERLAPRLGMKVKAPTLLRYLRSISPPSDTPVRVLGIDDFAMRRGDSYGTILVNIETGKPLDLLPDRTAEAVLPWLARHQEIEVVSRDRASAYADAVKRALPHATQVADRYHLVQNLREHLQRFLDRKRTCLPEIEDIALKAVSASNQGRGGSLNDQTGTVTRNVSAGRSPAERTDQPQEQVQPELSPVLMDQEMELACLTYAERKKKISRDKRYARYEHILALHRAGMGQRAIARELQMSRRIVQRYPSSDAFPERAPGSGLRAPGKSKLDPYLVYLRERWSAGEHSGSRLFSEIKERGYTGSASLLRHVLGEWRTELPPSPRQGPPRKLRLAPKPRKRRLSSRGAAFLMILSPSKLTEVQKQRVAQMNLNEELRVVYLLSQEFVTMLKEGQAEALDSWLKQAKASHVTELGSFVNGIRRDYAAVHAAFSLPWSNGTTEGHVNRLKFLKRQMFGRAHLDLLRVKVLHAV